MNKKDIAQSEDRGLSSYIKAKLGMSAAEFCRQQGIAYETLRDRWTSQDGRVRVMHNVHSIYIDRFHSL
jgi:hypothetical protein